MAIPITFLITDLHRGGTPLLLAALAKGLAARGQLDPDVVSIAPLGEVAEILRQARVPVASLKAAHARDVRVLRGWLAHLRRRRPWVVCSMLIHANLLATLARPFAPAPIVWVQSLHTVQERPRWHWTLQGMIVPFADAFIAPSHAVIDKLSGYGPVPRPLVIPNGIDVHRFHDARAIESSQRPWPEGAWVVGYVGRFDPVKRLPLMIEAVSMLLTRDPRRFARLHLAMVGYGPQEAELRALATRLGIAERVHFPGPTREPERWYKAFDVFCSPSPAEGFGLTLIEATAAGIPVIACGTAAVKESLPQALWLSPDPSPGEVAQAMEEASVADFHPWPITRLAEDFSLEHMINQYEFTLQSLSNVNALK